MIALNPADSTFKAALEHRVPVECFRPLAPHYLEDPRNVVTGIEGLVVAPRSTQEVSAIVRACSEAKVPIVPFGGGTGLVAGQLMADGPAPVILSLERMTQVRAVHGTEAVMIVEAGATLQGVQETAEENGLLFPLSLAAEGTCRIGGNLATNAGGVNVLRYGNARDLCLGIEAVLPDGQILNGLTRLRKDNRGFDLRNLLIGSEGSLGIITAAALRLFPIPASRSTALFIVRDPAAAAQLLALTRERLSDTVSAFELIQKTGFDFLAETIPHMRLPFEQHPDWAVLVELGLPVDMDGDEALMDLFEKGLAAELVSDGLIAQSDSQRADFWTMREHIPEANRLIGAIANHDVSLPLGNLPGFIAESEAAILKLGAFRINCFGHLGDGNLHFNVFPPKGETRESGLHLKPQIERLVHDLVQDHEGSFSAEHGIGRAKTAELRRYADPAKLAAMAAIKAALDPVGIMNPGAVLCDA